MSNDINNKEVGNRIRSIRKENGMTTDKLGKIFDPQASKGTVSKWENGHYLPNNERLVRIAELGKISVDELLYGSPKNYFSSIIPTNDISDLEALFELYMISFEDEPYQPKENILHFYNNVGLPFLDNINKVSSRKVLFAFLYSSYIFLDYSIKKKQETFNSDDEDLNFIIQMDRLSQLELQEAIRRYDKAFGLDSDTLHNTKRRFKLTSEDSNFSDLDLDSYFTQEYVDNLLKEEE